jgi:uncharacterized protein (DUF885 family)
MKALTLALATALLATGGTAAAQTAGDAQCIVLSNAFAGQAKDAKAKEVAEASLYFYLGRIGNSMTAAQLETLLDAQAKTITQASAGPAMTKCAAAIQAKVDMLKTISAPAKPAAASKPAQPGR